MSMITVDDYILGNGALHDRFRLTTEILGALVSSAPRPVSIAQLESYTGRPAKELIKLCGSLWQAMLMRPEAKSRHVWTLNCEPSSVTLEDVFRCVIASQPGRGKPADASTPANTDRNHHDVDLLVMQATMAINQSVFKHLRQFSLDRLKISAAAKPPAAKQAMRTSSCDNVDNFEVNSWLI
jgi:hypothetical protein